MKKNFALGLLFGRIFQSRKRSVLAVLLLLIVAGAAEYARQVPLVSYGTHINATLGTKEFFETPSGEQLAFLFVGDTGMGNENQKAVAQEMERYCAERKIAGVFFLGDNFYMDGVQSVNDAQWKNKFEDMYAGPCLSKTKFYSVLGNHDYKGNPSAQIEYYRLSRDVGDGRWTMPQRAYTVAFGSLLGVAAMDTNFPDACGLPFCSLNSMAAQLKKHTTIWKIALGHHPAISGGKYKKLNFFPNLTIPRFLCKEKFDFYFAGHDHNLQHLQGPSDNVPCELQQFIAGGGGANLVDVDVIPNITRFARRSYGFGVAQFEPKRATVELVQVQGGPQPFSTEATVVHRQEFTKQ